MRTDTTPDLDLELSWWGDCRNTFHEEQKQLVYAKRMGLVADWDVGHPPVFDMRGRAIVDIGGGPVSLLLKCVNLGAALVVDPCPFPDWIGHRYAHCGIDVLRLKAEHLSLPARYDEAWIYNVLQHTDDPERVIARARLAADTIRIFEWVNIPPYPGHPHQLCPDDLDRWIGRRGFTVHVNDSGAVGEAYYSVA
jgi:hypothetical protein